MFAAAPALAAEGGGAGMPQLNFHDYSPQLFWLAISFIILYWLMARVALPRVGEVLGAREQRIANDLDRAAALKAEAEDVLAAYQKALTEARGRAGEVLRETEAGAAKETAARQAKLAAELNERLKAAEGRITAAKNAAMANLRGVASDTARAAAERLLGEPIAPADADRATDVVMIGRVQGGE